MAAVKRTRKPKKVVPPREMGDPREVLQRHLAELQEEIELFF